MSVADRFRPYQYSQTTAFHTQNPKVPVQIKSKFKIEQVINLV